MLPQYPLVLAAAQADGAALSATTTPTNILHASGVPTIPAGALQIGSTLKILVRGRISTLATTPGTLAFTVNLGATQAWNSGNITLNTTAQTNATFELEILLTVRALGTTTATVLGTGRFTSRAVVGSAAAASGGAGSVLLPDTAPAVGTVFDSTAAQQVQVFATWGTSSVSNSIQTHQSVVELKV